MKEKFILNGKSELAECFGVSVNATSGWLLRGCPVLPPEGRTKYRFYIPDVVQWLGLGGPSDSDEPTELSLERARLARSQTEKTQVETKLKTAQLGHVLSGGVIPAGKARELFDHGEILVMQGFARMAVQVPADFFTDYLQELAEKRGEQFRLATMIDDWRFPVRDEFRAAARNLLARYLGEHHGQSSNDDDKAAPDDAA